jgi:hypothetical protein
MASTYSSNFKLEKMVTGANANTWGTNTNNNLDVLDAFGAGYLSKSVAGSSNITLTTANADPAAESSNKTIELTGALTGDIVVFIPATESQYTFFNNTTGSQTLTIAATGHTANGVAITQGAKTSVYCDGSANFNVEISGSTDAATGLGTGTVASARISGAYTGITGLGTLTTDLTTTANINLGDDDKAQFGASQDLAIYHNGSHSIIEEVGTGKLELRSNGTGVDIQKENSEFMARFITDGAAELYYDNSKKLETTTNGVHIQNGGLGVGTDAGTTDGQIRATDDITAFYSSDVALKENIHNIESPMDKVQQLNGVLFDWKEEYIKNNGGEDGYFVRKTDVGVIAQDVEKVLPEVVGTRPNGVKAVKYDRLCALLIECVKDLQTQVNDLKKGN